ncbi:hypothetical protein SGRA_1037 [Saprospira grandis str. Lewin]|uniref:Uncharacterized protein n=1 Tax=Saprospira grandis (strain Lewin) TaxID=984262 RepID=H6L3C5_SAPGL|nr:hypothetical protein SGRA_1037 [Saprospira grandis str. Lewin]
MFWGPRPARQSLAGRRYAAPLAALLGPAAAFGGLGLALRATAAQRWANPPLAEFSCAWAKKKDLQFWRSFFVSPCLA